MAQVAVKKESATGTMSAFVMRRIGEVGMMRKPIPDPGPNDAIVKTTGKAHARYAGRPES